MPVGSREATDSHEVQNLRGARGHRVEGQAEGPGAVGVLNR